MELPPGAEMRGGQLVRIIKKTSGDGTEWEQVRPVALTQSEAKRRRQDWYHPQLGWVREGYKLATDRSPASKMQDDSSAVAVREEDRPQEAQPPVEVEL